MKDEKMRVFPKIKKVIRDAKLQRIVNGLEKDLKLLSDREITRMWMNTPSFSKSIKELETLPRKEDLIR